MRPEPAAAEPTGPPPLDEVPPEMSPALQGWAERVLRELNEHFPLQVRRLYQDGTNLRHYWDLAASVEHRFEDPVLARSAFLHGIPCHELHQPPDELVETAVRSVLEEREKLRALNPRDEDVREQLLANVLPTLSEARAVVLFVLEQLHHLDPSGRLTAWSRTFHCDPQPPPPGLGGGPWFKKESEREITPPFISSVVAPIAEYFGLWLERDALEDAVALHFQAPLVERILAFVEAESRPGGTCEELLAILGEPLPGLGTQVTWEWRHLGSLARRLPVHLGPRPAADGEGERESDAKAWKRFLFRAGAVQIRCPDVATCYAALGRLHQAFSHRPTEIEDHLGRVETPGRPRLQTVLIQPGGILADELPGDSPALTVLLSTEEDLSKRHLPGGRAHLEEIQSRLQSKDRRGLRVFAPDGRGWDLPAGATVLEFAAQVNHRWLVHLAGATVNRRPVSLLHRLEPGDVAWLDLSKESWPLPRGWEAYMTSEAVRRKIRREFSYHYRPALKARGRLWLRDRLRHRGAGHLPEDKHLDLLLEDAAQALRHFRHKPGSSVLLRQLGLLAAQAEGTDLPYRLFLNEALAERLVEQTALEVHRAGLIEVNDLDLPPDLHSRTERVTLCPNCQPAYNRELVATVDEKTLVLHAPGFVCAEEGRLVSRYRILARPQYFVLEARNRVGLAADILQVFRQQGVNVREFVGVEEGGRWGIARVGIERVSQGEVETLMRNLRRVAGIERLASPESGEAPDWESPLPPRQPPGSTPWSLAEPYICGNDITQDVYFYGMSHNRAQLAKLFAQTVEPAADQGRTAFIQGPKRAGKTSLARHFLREVERRTSEPCVTVYFEAPTGFAWSWVERQVGKELLHRARRLAGRLGATLPAPDSPGLAELVRHVQERLGATVVVVIDEVTTLFAQSGEPEEVEQLARFRSQVEALPHLLLLWVGPLAQVRDLDPQLRHLLQHAEQIPIGQLSSDDTRRLLAAENFGSKVRIRVPLGVAESVHYLTAGNPYWTSLLGRSMWQLAPPRRDGAITYHSSLLERAVNRLFAGEKLVFEDRQSSPPGSEQPYLVEALLALLVAEVPAEGPRALGLSALHQGLEREGLPVEAGELRRTLDYLQEQGTIREEPVAGRPAWKIAAPLLARFLRYLHSDDPAATEGAAS